MAKSVKIGAARNPFEGSPKDKALDKKGARATGKTLAQYEGSARDKKEDAGEGVMGKPNQKTFFGKKGARK